MAAEQSKTEGLVEHEVRVAATPERVFDYFTDPAKMVMWMGIEATLDPRPGGVAPAPEARDRRPASSGVAALPAEARARRLGGRPGPRSVARPPLQRRGATRRGGPSLSAAPRELAAAADTALTAAEPGARGLGREPEVGEDRDFQMQPEEAEKEVRKQGAS